MAGPGRAVGRVIHARLGWDRGIRDGGDEKPKGGPT